MRSHAVVGTDVTVWCTPPLPDDSGSAALLSSVEAARADSFRRAADRDRFITARALTRAALAETLGVDARTVDLQIGQVDGPAPGRPYVAGGPSFSISHAGSWVLVAVVTGTAHDGVAVGVDVGVDVESTDAVSRHLDDLVDALPAGERPPGGWTPTSFNRAWVRREAVLKAVGVGLLAPRDDLLLSSADASPAVVRSTGELPSPTQLVLRDIDLPGECDAHPTRYLAALALCSAETVPAALATVTTADGSTLLARHGVLLPECSEPR